MASDKLFNFLIYENGNIVYSKYNFDFNQYANDVNMNNATKIEIFGNFIKRNETDYFNKLTLNPIFKKYFKPMTQQIQTYIKKWGIIHSVWLNYVGMSQSIEYYEQNQFDLIEYDPVILIQDFLYSESYIYTYTKYNFNFDKYSSDFNIPDNKLVIFTDFIFRNYKLSIDPKYLDTPYYNLIDGYIVLPEFKKYCIPFLQTMRDYISTVAPMSNNLLSDRIMSNIDFSKYSLYNQDLPEMTIDQAKEHFIYNGQFQMVKLTYFTKTLKPIEKARKNVCTVYLNNRIDTPVATGFLYKKTQNNYLVTVYHTIKAYPDQRYIYAIFENDADNNFAAQFRIIGYDIITDILIAIYDPILNFNGLYKPDFSKQEYLEIDYSHKPLVGSSVTIIGNSGLSDNLTTINANIMNHNYSGGFDIDGSAETLPDSLLLQCIGNIGMSGSPVLVNKTNTNSMQIIGIVLGALSEIDSSVIAVNNYIVINVIRSIIQRWELLQITGVTGINKIDDFIKNGYPKSWLGIINQYYHPVLANTYKELSNFKYIGGLVITNFIVGYNFRDGKYVYTTRDLVDLNVIKLDGPLLNTKIFNRFISSGNVPIVIKSIRYYDTLLNEPTIAKIGKYGDQVSYSRYVYGNHYTSLNQLSNTNYYNLYTMRFMPITIEYFYYDGKNWQPESEVVGSDGTNTDSDWYVDYTDNIGNVYHQHKFEYPLILLPYFEDYSINKYSN